MKKIFCFDIISAVRLFCAIGLLHMLIACGAPTPRGADARIVAEAKLEQQLARLSTLRYIDDIVKARTHVADSVDVHTLQASPLRDRFLHTWLHLYAYDADLLPDARNLITRALNDSMAVLTDSTSTFRPLVQALCNALLEDGREEAAVILAAHNNGFPVEPGTTGEIAHRMLRQLTLYGQPAPPIEGLAEEAGPQGVEDPTNELLVVFYESDCSHCLIELAGLTERYPTLRAEGVRVVSIALDARAELYEPLAQTLPWPDKLCDYKGFGGENATRWGVWSTPQTYRVDAKTGEVTTE